MWRNNKVLVIDDNDSRRHDLHVLLEFLSETTLMADSVHWRNLVENEKIKSVLKNDFQNDSVVFEKKLPLAVQINNLAVLNAKIISFKTKLLSKE